MGELHISRELHAAQLLLLQMRAQLHGIHSETNRKYSSGSEAQECDKRPFPPDPPTVAALPPHLGWHSKAVSQTIRQNCEENVTPRDLAQESFEAAPPVPPAAAKTIKVYPDIALGLLKQQQVAAGRLWLLLQAVDVARCGWVKESKARQLFTGKRGLHSFCGARQLRNLLAQGENIFWVRQNGRIWLRSVAKVAFKLKVVRLKMRPVAFPVSALRQNIGTVRAHLYATFHSSRSQKYGTSRPIARKTVARLTRVQPRTQRRYEAKASVKRQPQFAVGKQSNPDNLQSRAWEQGRATFLFKDFKGRQGPQGKSYVAWQLPNSYVGPHARQPKGRQKRINRMLRDLFMQGITGNGQQSDITRCFFENGRLAAKAYLRNPERDHYWRGAANGRYQLWQVMEGCKQM